MSDLCLYKLEDSVWDEICQSDDHIVPHTDDQSGYENAFQGDICKKSRREVLGVSSNPGDCYAAIDVSDRNDGGHFPTLKNQSSRMSSHRLKYSNLDSIGSEGHADDLTLGGSCAAFDNNSSHYPLVQIENNFSFSDNDRENKESNGIQYYGWPDIGNFEDVDRMFRNCDSTLGRGGGVDGDGLGWFSSSHVTEGSASNQLQFMESSHGYSFEAYASRMDENQGKLHHQHGFQTSFMSDQKQDLVDQAASNSESGLKQVHHSDNKVDNHREVEAIIQAEMDSSNVQESSCMSSGFDEISLEATSFRQLKHVMETLDIRTRLCIRDSLYRLARSAEQRNNYMNLKGGCRDDVETSGALMDEGTNNGWMDMETDTNPIDRSIAHLLFHRSSDSSAIPA